MSSKGSKPNKPGRPCPTITAKLKARLAAAKARKVLSFNMLAEAKHEGEMLTAKLADPDDLMDNERE